jgi:hypothetical protein
VPARYLSVVNEHLIGDISTNEDFAFFNWISLAGSRAGAHHQLNGLISHWFLLVESPEWMDMNWN